MAKQKELKKEIKKDPQIDPQNPGFDPEIPEQKQRWLR